MELKDILSIAGAPGLYKYVAQGKGGIIVESLSDSRRQLVSGTSKVSALGDIAMFTDAEEITLGAVFQNIFEKNQGRTVEVNAKSDSETLKKFMEEALPSYDRDRVHISDIKKLASWYNILVGAGMNKFIGAEGEEAKEEAVAPSAAALPKPVAKKAAVNTKQPKTATSQPKIVAPKSTTNRKSS
ncbi:hypothetical protein BN938_2116 [Mucinivorans hirudinis]|uniref:Uncharacterized protein n=1 Tax=Mucinivorans hirudinis TaxID=1433126 RepID=A0A060RDX1_9BACT|nr:hypothetical protein BN938_2116 [Mucinivorans hirudinis]